MNSANIAATFESAGAVLLAGVLRPEDVTRLRQRLHEAFAPLDRRATGLVRTLSRSVSLSIPELGQAVFHPRIVAALRAVLGPEVSLLPDFDVQRNLFDFTDTRRSASHLFGLIGYGWHHDAGAEGANPYLFDPDYRQVKCGIYLQDATDEWGGDIEIAPGGHRRYLRTGNFRRDYRAIRASQNLRIVAARRRVGVKAGDVLIFDAWLPHRGVQPHGIAARASDEEKACGCLRLPAEHTKLTLYFNAARTRCAHHYLEHSVARGESEMRALRAGRSREVFFADFAGMRYPADYPADFVTLAESAGVGIAQLDGALLARAQDLRHEAMRSGRVDNGLPNLGSAPA